MPIYVGSNEAEHTPILAQLADGVRPLTYPNPAGGAAKSYDLHVVTKSGQDLRGERKRHSDLKSSMFDGRLDAQCGAVDFVIVEWNQHAILGDALDLPTIEEEQALLLDYENAYKRYARLCLAAHVIRSDGPEHTMALLRYIEQHDDPYAFDNRIRVKAPTLRERLVRSLSPSITPEAFAAIWPTVDRDALIAALGVASWPINPTVRKRILKDLCQP